MKSEAQQIWHKDTWVTHKRKVFFSEEEYYSDFPTLTINVAHLT